MAEYNFKRLTDVEALPEVPEGANALVEVNGEVKRVPGDGLGGGAVLGEDGKLLSAVLPDGYPYEEEQNIFIEWDGNTEGLELFGNNYVKISDEVLTKEQLIGATLSYVNDISTEETLILTDTNVEETTTGVIIHEPYSGSIVINSAEISTFAAPALPTNLGVWLEMNDFKSFRLEKKISTVHAIDYKYLPEGYPRKELLHNLCWDGNIEGVDNFTFDNFVFYKISDDVLTSDQLIGSTVFVGGVDENEIFAEFGLSNTFSIESSMVQSSEDGTACMVMQIGTIPNIISSSVVDLNGVTLPSIGTYVLYVAEGTTLENITFTSPVFVSRLTKSTTHPITEEFLPAGAGIKTAIIKDSNYDNALAGVQTAETEVATTYECINMTFEEAYETMMKGEPLAAHIMLTTGSLIGTLPAFMVAFDTSINSFMLITDAVRLYWTADGLSTEAPASA